MRHLPYDWVLCDLGNTLLNFDHEIGVRNLVRFTHGQLTPATVQQFLFAPTSCGATRSQVLDRGHADLPWLCDELHRETGVWLTPRQLAPLWNELFTTYNDDVIAAMTAARRAGLRVGLVSTTNRPHWDYLRLTYPRLYPAWDVPFLSFECGLLKTDPGYFPLLVRETGAEPARHLIIDDLPDNVAAAQRCGIHGWVFTGTLPSLFSRLAT